MKAPSFTLPPRAPWRPSRRLQGCLLTVVLLFGSCLYCMHSDEWERFEGAQLGRGTHDATVSGDTNFVWHGPATLGRVSAMAGEDGYVMELFGANAYQEVGFEAGQRPHPGTFAIHSERVDGARAATRGFHAGLSTSNRSDDSWSADSGTVTLTDSAGTLRGRYAAYMSRSFLRDSTWPRHVVVRGTLSLHAP